MSNEVRTAGTPPARRRVTSSVSSRVSSSKRSSTLRVHFHLRMTMHTQHKRPSTPAQPPPHCNSTARRVRLWGWSRFPSFWVVSQVVGEAGRSVVQSVEVSTNKIREQRSGNNTQREARVKSGTAESGVTGKGTKGLKKSSRLGQPRDVG